MMNRDDRVQSRYRAVVLVVSLAVVSAACDPTGGSGGSLPAEFPVVSPAVQPNDPRYREQWALALLSAPEAWGVIATPALAGQFRPTVVAVLDGMIDLDHPDLAANVVVADGWDFIKDRRFTGSDENPSRSGIDHGTHVAGIIAAVHNSAGVAGLGRTLLTVMPIRILGDEIPATGTFSDLYSAMRYAAGLPNETGAPPSRPAKVINLSLGSSKPPFEPLATQLIEMIAQLNRIGVVVVAASGNSGAMQPTYPAAYPGVISVGSVDADRQVSRFSNGGLTLDFVAPGGSLRTTKGVRGILSTVYRPTAFSTPDTGRNIPPSRYGQLQGTSMAAPYVAAIAALILAYEPSLSADEVYRILAETSQDLGTPGGDNLYGWGLVNADRALRRAMMVPFGRYRLDTAVLTGSIGASHSSSVVTGSALATSPAEGVATADPIPGVYLVKLRARGAEAHAEMAALADRLDALESTDLGGGLWRLRVAPHTTDATVQATLTASDLVDFVTADHRIAHFAEPVETVVPFELVYHGARSGVATQSERLYTTVAALQSEPWFALFPTESRERTLQWLRSGRSVAALFAGSRPTGGYHVRVERVTAEADRLRVRYRVVEPDPGLIVTQALTAPYAVLLVDGAFSGIEALPLP